MRYKDMKYAILITVILFAGLTAVTVVARSNRGKSQASPNKYSQKEMDEAVEDIKKGQAGLVKAAQDRKESIERLLALQENDVKTASQTLEIRKELFDQGLSPKWKLDNSEKELANAKAKIELTRKQLQE